MERSTPRQPALASSDAASTRASAWLASPLHAAMVHVVEVAAHAADAAVAGVQIDGFVHDAALPSVHARVIPSRAGVAGPCGCSVDWPALQEAVDRWRGAPGCVFSRIRGVRRRPGTYLGKDAEAIAGVAADRALGRVVAGWSRVFMGLVVVALPSDARAVVVTLRCGVDPVEAAASTRLPGVADAIARRLREGYARGAEPSAWPADAAPQAGDPGAGRRRFRRLSKTERTVLHHLVGEPVTERQVAEAMHRSPHTVHVHVKSIYRKLGVSSRSELNRVVQRLGGPDVVAA